MNILHFHGRVIDQHSHRQRKSAERHQVDRLSGKLESDNRGQDSQWYRGDDDNRAAPGAQEQQCHEADQRRRQGSFLEHVS